MKRKQHLKPFETNFEKDHFLKRKHILKRRHLFEKETHFEKETTLEAFEKEKGNINFEKETHFENGREPILVKKKDPLVCS